MLKLKRKEKEKWYPIHLDNEEKDKPFRVKIYHLTKSEIAAINRRYSETKWIRGEMKEVPVPDADDLKARDIVLLATKDWENYVDDEGKPIPCTDEEKNALCEDYQEIAVEIINRALSPLKYQDSAVEKN